MFLDVPTCTKSFFTSKLQQFSKIAQKKNAINTKKGSQRIFGYDRIVFCQGLILRGFHCAYIIAACASFTLTCHCS